MLQRGIPKEESSLSYLRGFVLFWYDFIVGDAWEVAAGLLLALTVIAALAVWFPQFGAVYGPLFAFTLVGILSGSLWWEAHGRGQPPQATAPAHELPASPAVAMSQEASPPPRGRVEHHVPSNETVREA